MTRPHNPAPLLSRREFARLAGLACAAAACTADGSGPTAPQASGINIDGNTLTLLLSQNPALSASNGLVLVAQRSVLVFRLSSTEYGALASVCTHQACTVSSFDGSRLTCPCHGSQFSPSGAVTRGPAAVALRAYQTSFDSASGTITVNLA